VTRLLDWLADRFEDLAMWWRFRGHQHGPWRPAMTGRWVHEPGVDRYRSVPARVCASCWFVDELDAAQFFAWFGRMPDGDHYAPERVQ
jgi:hypothetical protein